MTTWGRRESWHLRLDASLRTYVAQIVHLMSDRTDADVLDVGAGSGWLGQLPFASYHPVDIDGTADRWDIDEPLPDHLVGRFDLVVCLGALHYAFEPHRSLARMVRALAPGGELVASVPWLYPPHDLGFDRWRISPRQLWRLMDEHFSLVDIHPNGSVFHLPMHVLNRYLTGPFRGVHRRDLERMRRVEIPTPWQGSRVEDIPVRRSGPMVVLAHGRDLRAGVAGTGSDA